MARYIFIIGGVMSGIGKGTITASIGKILKSKGYKVTCIKADPYLNVDAGTMNPTEHGEVFVTKDGVETDQDIGTYERFLGEELSSLNYLTSGKVYLSVLTKERNLEYGGKCVEAVPHIPEEIISQIKKCARETKADFVLVEIGGTVGEYQNQMFMEAARMMHLKEPNKVLFVLVSYLPIPQTIGEMKTKPTQTACRLLNEAGIQPDIIIGRAECILDFPRKKKIATFCNVDEEDVISSPDVENIYEVPLVLEKENLGDKILRKFNLRAKKKNLLDWEKLISKIKNLKKKVKIAIVGKYFEIGEFTLLDSYISVMEAIKHSAWTNNVLPEIVWVSAWEFEKSPQKLSELSNYSGVIVPGGFGKRDVEGKILAIKFCRENKIPYLGLCFGLQLAVIEFARNVANIKDATSREFSEEGELVIDFMPEQKALIREKKYGGTMRLGEYKLKLFPKTLAFKAYQRFYPQLKENPVVLERHRHRYEVNPEYVEILKEKGLVISGINPERDLVEIIELKDHPFFLGTQFHPEFKSQLLKPHPLFFEFIRASIKNLTF